MVQQFTLDNWQDTISREGIVIVDFWAPWCGPCRFFKPIFEEASQKHPDITFASCNTEEQPELAAMFRVQAIPTITVFRDGIMVYSEPGALPADMLEKLIEQVKALDMEAIKRELEQARQAANA